MNPEPPPAHLVEISPDEALKLLAGVSFGRVVFSDRALPAVRPVNHILDDGFIVIRTHSGAAILGPAGAVGVVAYEADRIDDEDHTGWSVVVTGAASPVRDPGLLARYERLLRPWTAAEMQQVVRISPGIVSGYRLTRDP